MNQDLGLDLSKPETTVKRGGAAVDVHAWRGKRLLWAPHPAAHLPPEKWVESVVAAAGGGEREAGGEHNSLTLLKIIKIRHLIAERKRLTL